MSSSPLSRSRSQSPCKKFANDHAAAVVQAWRGLHDDLLVQFSDGWNYDGVSANVVGYPADCRVEIGLKKLQAVGSET